MRFTLDPMQIAAGEGVTVTVIEAFTVTVMVAVEVQPNAFVPVTV